LNLGDTFVNAESSRYPSHLWFIVSHPDGAGRVVIVNISSDAWQLDDLEKLGPDDHPWIKHASFIRADLAMLSPVAAIEAAFKSRPPAATKEAPATSATINKLQSALGR